MLKLFILLTVVHVHDRGAVDIWLRHRKTKKARRQ